MSDYIPRADDAFRTFAEVFAANISSWPSSYMLAAAEAASIQKAVDSFVAKLAVAQNKLTRTRGTIADKDDARSIAEHLIRCYALLIKHNHGISDGDKLAIGVRPIRPSRQRRGPPGSTPLLSVLGCTPGVQSLRFSDANTPDSRAKPYGVTELQLFRGVHDDERLPVTECQFYRKITRNPVQVPFTQADDGKLATYYARWATKTGQTGPWSNPVSFRIAA